MIKAYTEEQLNAYGDALNAGILELIQGKSEASSLAIQVLGLAAFFTASVRTLEAGHLPFAVFSRTFQENFGRVAAGIQRLDTGTNAVDALAIATGVMKVVTDARKAAEKIDAPAAGDEPKAG